MRHYIIPAVFLLVGCGDASSNYDTTPFRSIHSDEVVLAYSFYGWKETTHRNQLKELVGVDPVQTEWCAAFVNAVLRLNGKEGSESVSEYPLTARSFLAWGTAVKEPESGDIVVFPRGNQGWQGHVGFYVRTAMFNGEEHYVILGGNQDDSVSLEYYPASKAIGIRRP
jgi:uncharacterized protein (TIGR02594 family)